MPYSIVAPGRLIRLAALAVVLAASPAGLMFQPPSPAQAAPPMATPQATYATPEAAAQGLVDAVRLGDVVPLRKVLGPGSEALITSGDRYADAEQRKHFLESYDLRHALTPGPNGTVVLDVGENHWPLPIPLVKDGDQWRWDSTAGARELVDRRIGRNELATIRTMLTYVDAQKAYAAQTSGQYAQRLIARRGTRDGLYWPAADDQPQSPLGPLIEDAQAHGYPGEAVDGRPVPYQGYYYRILTGQGPSAPGGARNYIDGGRMTGGYALIAWPASYDASGVVTFIVNQDGVVYQKDLGPGTAQAVRKITRFNPDISWARVDIVN